MADQIYRLPELAYDYDALEPYISAEIMQLHHDTHHAAYVAGANTALAKLAAAREHDDFGSITKLEKDLAFHLSGHVLHSLFWENLGPVSGEPEGALAEQLGRDFG
ncbi:MAG TPA: superoxide dismutase, partial [Acidimicrobiales bacterium]|nr:superoxide dismutase [Acidimicrobiales bacterium]